MHDMSTLSIRDCVIRGVLVLGLLNIFLISLLGNLLSAKLLIFRKLLKSVVAFEKLGNLLLL